jgi:5,10-methylenetetrahydrofolate reductase
VSVEIDPPRSIRIERTIEAARLLRDAGVDLVNVSDSAMARVRMSALSVAFGIQHDLDLECLVHCTTRDRNLGVPLAEAERSLAQSLADEE